MRTIQSFKNGANPSQSTNQFIHVHLYTSNIQFCNCFFLFSAKIPLLNFQKSQENSGKCLITHNMHACIHTSIDANKFQDK